MVKKHLKITGRVQGVGYRYFVYRQADELGISGWVRNLPDGSVETLIEGTPEDIDEIVRRIRSGPVAARVSGVQEIPVESHERAEPASFRILK